MSLIVWNCTLRLLFVYYDILFPRWTAWSAIPALSTHEAVPRSTPARLDVFTKRPGNVRYPDQQLHHARPLQLDCPLSQRLPVIFRKMEAWLPQDPYGLLNFSRT